MPTTPTAPIARTDAPSPPVAEPSPVPPRVGGPVDDALDAYDALRLALAHDDDALAKKSAANVAVFAKKAADASTDATKAPLADLAKAADKLANGADITAMRAAFADVNRDVVGVIVGNPALQTGRFLFMCPMAKGYQKWVQTTTKLENPFFGKAMIDCGEQLKAWSV